jgi:hypothetical protein
MYSSLGNCPGPVGATLPGMTLEAMPSPTENLQSGANRIPDRKPHPLALMENNCGMLHAPGLPVGLG